ncbi:hypothetical protein [uncultured Bacteroides sp.]|uniref:hypothetical protein n=1 Tax=uncultured Bacteroides sp. TaxID=162156 RepID=UPI00259AA9FB|nr:hypothetical protein [uncultured Bacteroides sp.]
METGAMKNKKKTTEDVNIDFNKAIGKSESNCLHCMRYGGYLLFSTIRDFFLGEKPTKKNDDKFADLAETLISTIPDNPNSELLSSSEKLLKQQRMLEDTRARRRLERWATKAIAYYLVCVFLLIVVNGVVLILNPIETTEIIGSSGVLVKRGFISDSIMTVILTTTTINIIGLGVIVLKGHFDKNKDN